MHKIKKAIIPLAGLATRIYPMNKVTKKSLLPICDKKKVKPVILKLCEELYDAGIKEIYMIIGKNDRNLYKNLFQKVDSKIYNKLTKEDKLYEEKIETIGKCIKYIIQEEALGLAHAVYQAKDYMNQEPACLLILGDTIYKSIVKESCVEQLLNYYDEYQNTIIALQELEEQELKYYGIIYGKWDNKEQTKIILEKIIEKPTIEYARKNLLINGKYYGNFGEFIVTKELFEELEKIMNTPLSPNKEHQLMEAFNTVIQKGNSKGIIIKGKSYDVGNIDSYIKTLKEL